MPRKIKLNGEVIRDRGAWIYDWLGIPAISPANVSKALEDANGEDVELYINSPGGIVDSGSEIYTMLKEYTGKITAKITGIAASAASFLAMAADEVLMSPTSMMMIHNAAIMTDGDKNVHQNTAQLLSSADNAIISAYQAKTGLSQEELFNLMNKTTWMNAKEAKEKGFADAIMFEDNETPAVVNSFGSLMTPEVMNKLGNLILAAKEKGQDTKAAPQYANGGFVDGAQSLSQLAFNMPHVTIDSNSANESWDRIQGLLNRLNNTAATLPIEAQKEEPKTMDFKELQEKHPGLVNEIMTQAINAERSRIADLHALVDTTPGAAAFVKDAIANGETAGETAMKILKANADRVKQEGANREADAQNSGVTTVVAQQPANPVANEAAEEEAAVKNMVAYATEFIKKKGGRL